MTATPEPDQLVVRLDPSTGVRIGLDARRADSVGPARITLDMEFAQEGGEGPTPYEVLLLAAMRGDSSRFTRQDGVEETWRIMQPLLDSPPPVKPYAPGTWGPAAADTLVNGFGRWHAPGSSYDRRGRPSTTWQGSLDSGWVCMVAGATLVKVWSPVEGSGGAATPLPPRPEAW